MSNICGEKWNLVFLDTNAISNLISNYKNFGKNLLNKFNGENVYYVFSIYNMIEISNGDLSRFEKFKDIFSSIKCFMFWEYQDILKEEYNMLGSGKINYSKIAYSFIPNFLKEYDFKYFIEEKFPGIKKLIDAQLQAEENLLEFYNIIKNSGKRFAVSDEKYELEVIKDCLRIFKYDIKEESKILETFKSARLINKSVYNRITQGNKAIGKNDLYDIMICSIFPYVDTIITENYQIEMIKQMKRKIPELESKMLYRISEFYDK